MPNPTLAEVISNAFDMKRPRVSFRRYGMNGELQRPIIHRFNIKGGVTLGKLMTDNMVRTNPLLAKLMKRGKCMGDATTQSHPK